MDTIKPYSISAFFPAFNDAEAISVVLQSALEVLPRLTDDYEVLVIDDGSTDATAQVLAQFALTCPELKIVHHARNMGYGAALRSGFAHSTKDLIFYTDGDGQYDARELSTLHECLTGGVDVVNGFKVKRADQRHREVLGGIYNRLARRLFRLPIRDVDCDFRLLRRSALERISLGASSGAICVELVHKLHTAGCVFAEAPVTHSPRLHGKSQFFRPRSVAKTMFDFFVLWSKLMLFRRFASRSAQYRSSIVEHEPTPE